MADDSDTVCAMCGDVGLPDKLFRCTRCVSRHQHSYCSNYYEKTAGVCDWCLIEERKNGPTSKKKGSSEKIKRGGDHKESGSGGKGSSGNSSSSKPSGQRYKLLKDVLS